MYTEQEAEGDTEGRLECFLVSQSYEAPPFKIKIHV